MQAALLDAADSLEKRTDERDALVPRAEPGGCTVAGCAGATCEHRSPKPAQTLRRCDQPGWVDIGKSDGRRSLWIRMAVDNRSFELCAGREGDDDYLRVDESTVNFLALVSVFASAIYAAGLADEQRSPEPPCRMPQMVCNVCGAAPSWRCDVETVAGFRETLPLCQRCADRIRPELDALALKIPRLIDLGST